MRLRSFLAPWRAWRAMRDMVRPRPDWSMTWSVGVFTETKFGLEKSQRGTPSHIFRHRPPITGDFVSKVRLHSAGPLGIARCQPIANRAGHHVEFFRRSLELSRPPLVGSNIIRTL